MFSKVIKNAAVPPNFLNSILTNPSLYEMFKNDYESNKEYFQGLDRDEYLSAMLSFIENVLFSKNMFNIYNEPDDLETITKGKLEYIRNFYDDFLLDEFRRDADAILKTKFFRGMVFASKEDKFASKTSEFSRLFDYVFSESLDYADLVDVLIKEPVRKLEMDEVLSLKEFDVLCNYVKNNIEGFVPMMIVTKMLKNHAYKTNHIFDEEVVKSLVSSVAKSYLLKWGIEIEVEFMSSVDIEEESSYSIDPNRVILDEELLNAFLCLNYTEIFTELLFELERLKHRVLLKRNEVNYDTLKVIMEMFTTKVDFAKLYVDENYTPQEYIFDLRASSFIKTLRFFESFGVNLFQNFIECGVSKLDLNIDEEKIEKYSYKEISLDQRFARAFTKYEGKSDLIRKFAVLRILFDSSGHPLATIDLIKKSFKGEHSAFIEEYLHSRIIEPEVMIEDVGDLAGYRPKDEHVRAFIERELKYIYVDSFYYSLNSYLKLRTNPRFDKEDYLLDLAVKVNCIKDTPLTHRFIDEAFFTIEEAKQSI